MAASETTGLQLRSLIRKSGELELSLARVPSPTPAADEVVVRVEASPINPSDLGLLLGPADLSAARSSGVGADTVVTAPVPDTAMRAMEGRLDKPMNVGNEGAGVVVAAGDDATARALIGKTVAVLGGSMYAQYRLAKADDCLVLPEWASAADGASCFINPLTSLGMVETMRREGHTALVHTAAASNLGQMLNKLCQAEGIGLVNIVRSPAQAKILTDIGANYVCDSTAPSFRDDLVAALAATGATLAFDAIGGGELASRILAAMEVVATRDAPFSRYGSNTHKQVYLYGGLDTRPTELRRSYGMAWSVGGWLMTPFLQKIGPAETERLRRRVLAELKTTFASHYTQVISLTEALQLPILAAYAKRATGEKFLVNPNKPGV